MHETTERMVEIAAPEGRMDAFIAHPRAGSPRPAVLLMMDIWGLREELYGIARRIAGQGYYCILPNTYYRQGRIRFEYRNEKGQMRSIEDLDQATQDMLRRNMFLLTEPMLALDVGTILGFLESEPVSRGLKGAVGYCMGGRHALTAAGHYPDAIRATVSLHGTRLVTESADSPHLLADRFKGEIYCGFAERDALAPPATIEALARLLKGRPGLTYDYIVHAGTDHGYTLPDRDIYDRAAAEKDWERIFALLGRQLGG